ncbi:MAG: sugar transferase, partial [Thermoleophilia bacterium]
MLGVMPVREVALDRDIRSARWLPTRARLHSAHSLRRAASVASLVIIDSGSLAIAVALVSLTAGTDGASLWQGLSWWGLAASCATVLVTAALWGLYGRRHARHSARRILMAWVAAFVVSMVVLLAVDSAAIGPHLVVAWFLALVLSLVARWTYDALLAARYGPDGENPPAILLGAVDSCLQALPVLAALAPGDRVTVAALVVPPGEDAERSTTGPEPPIVATYAGLEAAIRSAGATQVIVADARSLDGQLRHVMDSCRRGGVALKILATDLQSDSSAVVHVPGMDSPLFVVRPRPAGRLSYAVKKASDYAGSAVLLITLSPLLLVIAAAIKLTSRGPVLFVEERIGTGQRPFRFYKFRTMVADARAEQAALETLNEAGGVLFKIHDDPRVTRVGLVLRRFSLDELPQLLNVLKGDMSLVG